MKKFGVNVYVKLFVFTVVAKMQNQLTAGRLLDFSDSRIREIVRIFVNKCFSSKCVEIYHKIIIWLINPIVKRGLIFIIVSAKIKV